MCLPSKVRGSTIQSIASAIGGLLCVNFGIMYGITPAHMRLYQSPEETPLNAPIDANGANWLLAHLFLGASLSALFSNWLAARIGPKSVLLLCGLLQIAAWSCMHFGYALIHIYASRLFAGVSAGTAFVVLPIFIQEVTQTRDKAARLLLCIDAWRTLGTLIGFALGFYLRYDYVSVVGCCLSFVFSLLFPFVQESPYYFQHKGDLASMEKALRWFRGIRDISDHNKPQFVRELSDFRQAMQVQQNITVPLVTRRGLFTYQTLICLLLMLGSQLSGAFVILSFASDFLADGVSNTSFGIAAGFLVLAAVQFVGALLARLVGPRLPRKWLLCVSAICAALSLITLALRRDNIWQAANPTLDTHMPILLMSIYCLFVSSGLVPLSTVVTSELLPPKSHGNISALSSALAWLLLFGLIKSFDVIVSRFDLTCYLWFFAGSCLCICAVLLCLLPETRGRSLAQIRFQMGYATTDDIAKSTELSNGHISHI